MRLFAKRLIASSIMTMLVFGQVGHAAGGYGVTAEPSGRSAAAAPGGMGAFTSAPMDTVDTRTDAQTDEPVTAADELIVVFAANAGSEERAAAHKALGTRLVQRALVGGRSAELVKLSSASDRNRIERAYAARADVAYVQPNFIYRTAGDAVTPNDTHFIAQWALKNTGSWTGIPDADIDADEAWGVTQGSETVVVAVTDTGVDRTHPELAPNIWSNPDEIAGNGIDDDKNGYVDDVRGWDFVSNDADPSDAHGHGTHVAGTIAARGNNGAGIAGVAWNVKVMPLKMMNDQGSGRTLETVAAIEYAAANGADVINASWGIPLSEDLLNSEDTLLREAIETAGVLFVAAAGNDAYNNDGYVRYFPASFESDNIIAVAASTSSDTLADFSHYGATSVDLAAPGEDIMSTVPGGYNVWSGTSMAAPHVSGVAALALSVRPGMNGPTLRRLLMSTTDVKASMVGKTASGGRLNARKAVDAAPTAPVVANVNRVAGRNRYATAAGIARRAHPGLAGVTHVIIASGEDKSAADPLSAAGLVWAFDGAPLLLVNASSVPADVTDALWTIAKRSPGPVRLHVVGGTAAVPTARVTELEDVIKIARGTVISERIGGANRYDTARKIAQKMVAVRGPELSDDVLVANGANPASFYDALSLSAISARNGAPVLLVSQTEVPAETAGMLATLSPARVVIGGGPNTVSAEVETALAAPGRSVDRWAGANRYETATRIATNAVAEGLLAPMTVSVAASLPDALASASISGVSGGPLLLTSKTGLPTTTGSWLQARKGQIGRVWVLGGVSSVSADQEAAIRARLK